MEQITGAGIVFLAAGKVLLLCRPDGSWGIPAGKIEDGETPEQAAIRETQEETGYACAQFLQPLKVVNNSDGCIFHSFSAELEAPFVPTINNEHMGSGWFPLDQLPTPLFECTPELVDMAQQISAVRIAACAMDRADASARALDANGWFEIKRNPISKVGVYPYLGKSIPGADPSVIYMVYRPAEELGSVETVESFKLLPWINDHTMLGNRPKTTPAEQKGVHGVIGQEVFFEGDTLYGNLKLFSGEQGTLIDSGKRELSSGYRCKYELAPGVFNGQPYTYVQRQIRGNHIASVDDGRMGPEVAVLDSLSFTFDAKDFQIMATEDTKKPEGEGSGEKDMTIGELTALVKSLMPQLKAMQDAMTALQAPPTDPAAAVVEDKGGDPAKTVDPTVAAIAEDAADTKKQLAAAMALIKGMPAEMLKSMRDRDQLATRLSEHVGVFDHADMTVGDVAKYGIEKLGIKTAIPAGSEAFYLDAYLTAKPAPSRARTGRATVEAEGMDAADTKGEKMPAALAAYMAVK